MRFIGKTGLLLAAVTLLAQVALSASFTASLDRETMTLGEQTTLSLKFEGGQPDNAPNPPNIPGLQFQYVGPSSSFSFINGQTTSSVTYNYIVTAEHAGRFTIPAIQANAGGQPLISRPLKLVVARAGAPPPADVEAGREPAFLRVALPRNKVYVGEPMVGELDLYLRDDVQGVNNFQLTSSPSDGFNAGKTAEQQGQRRRAQVGNHVYTIIPLTMPLTAIQPGRLTLGPFTGSVVVALPAPNQGGDPFFSRFFNQTEQKQVSLATESVAVESLPLPQANKPVNFTGAVGNFTMTSTAGPTTVTVGDPITVRTRISGSGALDALTLPPLDWRDFKTYPPTTKVEAGDQFGFQGTKTFEQIVSPENADVHELPALSFSYFNPDDGQYHTLTQAATPLAVKAAGSTPTPTLAAARNTPAENQPPQDILPIREKLGELSQKTAPLVTSPLFLAAQSLPVLAFLAALVWRRRTDNLANNPRLRRRRAVAQLVANGLEELKRHAAANQPDEFFATLFRLLQEQLGERLDCPATAITENVLDQPGAFRGAPPGTVEALREQFQLCNQARYAPVRGTSELNSVAAQFEKVSRQIQELKA